MTRERHSDGGVKFRIAAGLHQITEGQSRQRTCQGHRVGVGSEEHYRNAGLVVELPCYRTPSQVAEQYDYGFDTFHDGHYLAIVERGVRLEGNCVLRNQQDSIVADDRPWEADIARGNEISSGDG